MSTATAPNSSVLDSHVPNPDKAAADRDEAIAIAADNLHPVYDRIVIVPDSAEAQLASGLIIPANARVKSWRGTVAARGGGKALENGQRLKPCVNVGDSVLYEQYAGQEIEFDGHNYTIIKDADILSVIGRAASGSL